MSELEIPKGVFTKGAEAAAKVIALSALVFCAGFAASQAFGGSGRPAEKPNEIVQRLERIEQTTNQLALDLAVVKSRVDDLRDAEQGKADRRP